MISKVKPLHVQVDKTSHSIDEAEQKMRILETKRKVRETF